MRVNKMKVKSSTASSNIYFQVSDPPDKKMLCIDLFYFTIILVNLPCPAKKLEFNVTDVVVVMLLGAGVV